MRLLLSIAAMLIIAAYLQWGLIFLWSLVPLSILSRRTTGKFSPKDGWVKIK